MRIVLLVGLGLCAHAATAATLYKCVSTSRHVTYQSEPCPKEQSESWARDYPDGAPAAAAAKPAVRATPAAPVVAAPMPTLHPDASCEQAQREVARIEREHWLDLDMARLERLDDWVRERCAFASGSTTLTPRRAAPPQAGEAAAEEAAASLSSPSPPPPVEAPAPSGAGADSNAAPAREVADTNAAPARDAAADTSPPPVRDAAIEAPVPAGEARETRGPPQR